MTEQPVGIHSLVSHGKTSESPQRVVVFEPDPVWQELTRVNLPKKNNIQFCAGCDNKVCIGCDGAWEIIREGNVDTLILHSPELGNSDKRLVQRIRGKITSQPVVIISSEGASCVSEAERETLGESGVDVVVGLNWGYHLVASVVDSGRVLKESLKKFGPLLTQAQVEEAVRQLSRQQVLAS